ncbi:STAS domain-containing protein [Streptomyces sp. NPDC057193]|uniref:STAS domain-containing protein n=1 Tax=Streptomyces sp. NPDC057193 TaxID=3346043 RepID=UPI00362547F5
MSPLKITIRDARTGPVLEILGELDYNTAHELRDLLATITLRSGQRLVIDLAGLEFCDSSGFTALIFARNHVHATQADIALAAVPEHILRLLNVTGLGQIFPLYPDSEVADRPTLTRVDGKDSGSSRV